MIKYLIGEINYAGKIQKDEDKIVLQALIESIFRSDII